MPKRIAPAQMEMFDETGDTFEGLAQTNGIRYWFARDLMRILGYTSWAAFRTVVNKAVGVCTTMGVPVMDHFIQVNRNLNGKSVDDFKLTRLACCLTAMNGDSKLPQVAVAQMYFAALDKVLHDSMLQPESMDRITTREELSEREITLSRTAAAHGLSDFKSFQNEGYRGMYNMDLRELKLRKNIPDIKRSLLDFMGRDELAGNLFRLTLTEGRIKHERARGQTNLEDIAHKVGARVRKTMIEETGVKPEDLPIAADIREVRKNLKNTVRELSSFDDMERERQAEAEAMAQLPSAPEDYYPDCSDCQRLGTSHSGSPACRFGSLASGGVISHCNCEDCAMS